MPRRKSLKPKYCRYKSSGRAFVVLDGYLDAARTLLPVLHEAKARVADDPTQADAATVDAVWS